MNCTTADAAIEARAPRLGGALALLIGAVAAIPVFAGPGMVLTRAGGDSPFLLVRVQQLTANLQAGVFPARWLPDGAHGLGYPFYDFYASLPSYVASLLHWAGCDLVLSIQATQALGFLLASIATYALARSLSASPAAALLAAVVYTYAPYHLANVYVRGDALSEFTAMALYPLILLSLQGLRRQPSPVRILALGGSYAALVLCHNVSALLFTPLVIAWLAVTAIAAPPRRRHTLLWAGTASLVLGLLLSAWFWAPALRERSLVQLQEQTTGYLHYAGHFLRDGLAQLRLAHDYALTADTHPFRMGLVQAIIGLGALITLLARALRRQPLPPWQALTVIATLAYTVMMLPISRPLWDHLPLIAMAQFPWRLLSIQALLIALLAAELAPVRPSIVRWLAVAGIATLAAWGGMANLSPDRVLVTPSDTTSQRFMLYESFSGNIGTTIRHEYLPRWMVPRPRVSGVQLAQGTKPAPLVLQGDLISAVPDRIAPDHQTWSVETASPTLLAFHTTYYPGWEATVDGVPRGVEPLEGLGLIGLWVEAGSHRIELRFARTPVRRYSLLVSLGATAVALALAACGLRASRRLRRIALGTVATVLVSIAALVGISRLSAPASPPSGPLVADFDRCPLFHHEAEGIHWGEAHLVNYAIEPEVVNPGSTVYLRLTWETPTPLVARVRLVGLTGHLLPPAPVWAQATAPVDAPVTELQLKLPTSMAPGFYVIYLDLFDGHRELTPTTATGRSMGDITLVPIQVTTPGSVAAAKDPLATFGPPDTPPVVSLDRLHISAIEEELFIAELTWRALKQPPLNYWMSLRLKDADGTMVTSRDIPPFLGGYPTSLWKPGEVFTDRVLVPLPADAAQSVQQIEIVLYDRATLAGIGAVTVPVPQP